MAKLLFIDDCEFDAILGMDWLCEYHAMIDFRAKSVIFQIFGQTEFTFQGTSKATKTSMAIVITVEEEIPPVIAEFLDVIPKELLGLPPEREVKFTIELVLGTIPISKPHTGWP